MTSVAVRVTEEESFLIQQSVFSVGGSWNNGSTNVLYTNMPWLWVHRVQDGLRMTFSDVRPEARYPTCTPQTLIEALQEI